MNNRHLVLLDAGGHVRQEWEDCVGREWFENWFFEFAGAANLSEIEAIRAPALEKRLIVDLGFPKKENIWLVRTAYAQASLSSQECNLLSEDIDFRDPTQKSAKKVTRDKYLAGDLIGPVRKLLSKHSVEVLSLMEF